jgi:hypothetical protein
VRWLIVGIVLMGLTIVVFARGMRGLAVDVTVADDAVVRWLVGLQAPGLVGGWRALAALSSWWIINGLLAGLLVALLVLRRFRHLIVVLVLAQLLTLVVQAWVPPIAQRPRPFGVVIGASWGGWAMPSLQVTLLAALLVAILYAMVPEGRWRNTGKWVAAGLVTLTALGRIALGADAPTDALVAAPSGSPSPWSPSGCSLPTRSSRSPTGEAAPPTWTSAAHVGSRSGGAWRTSLAWWWRS